MEMRVSPSILGMPMSRMTASHGFRSSHDSTLELSVSAAQTWPLLRRYDTRKRLRRRLSSTTRKFMAFLPLGAELYHFAHLSNPPESRLPPSRRRMEQAPRGTQGLAQIRPRPRKDLDHAASTGKPAATERCVRRIQRRRCFLERLVLEKRAANREAAPVIGGGIERPQGMEAPVPRAEGEFLAGRAFSSMENVHLPIERFKEENLSRSDAPRRQHLEIEKLAAGVRLDPRPLAAARAALRYEEFGPHLEPAAVLHSEMLLQERLALRHAVRPLGGWRGEQKPGPRLHRHRSEERIARKQARRRVDCVDDEEVAFPMRLADVHRRAEGLLPRIASPIRAARAHQVEVAVQTKSACSRSHARMSAFPFSDLRSQKRNGRPSRMRRASLSITPRSAPT